jgi:hypothetical protein
MSRLIDNNLNSELGPSTEPLGYALSSGIKVSGFRCITGRHVSVKTGFVQSSVFTMVNKRDKSDTSMR